MESKLKVKLGQIEVECEGTESFIKQELPNLIKVLSELSKTVDTKPISDHGSHPNPPSNNHDGKMSLSTNTIASKISCESGADLIMAAALQLTLFKGKEAFSRQDILDEIKTAKAFYRNTYSKNLSSYLGTLVNNNQLNEGAGGQLSLTAGARRKLEACLAEK